MQLAEMNWPAIQALNQNIPVVIPVAALEQHGQHLPVFTDSMLLGEIVRRAAEQVSDHVLFAPLLWLGNSDHHLEFGGTLSAPPRTYLDMLSGIAQNFIEHGFKRILFLNGHGGNDVPGRQAVFELRQKYRRREDLLLLFATYWCLGAKPAETLPVLHQTEMGHACEWETSMILRIAPQLVGDIKHLVPVPFGNVFAPAYRGWITKDRSVPGHIGSPNLADAEKGEALFQIFTRDVLDLLERVGQWDGHSWAG